MTADTIRTSNVFLDTEVFFEANFNYNSPRLASLVDLVRSGRIRVFLTDLTVREIRANIKEAIAQAATTRPHPVLRNSILPKVMARLEPLDNAAVETELFRQFDNFIENARIMILPVKSEYLNVVLDRYFQRLPPFGVGKNKAEFPDALAIETLREWCRVEKRRIAVITRDEGVKAACTENGPLDHFEELPKYLDTVASENELLSDFIREKVQEHESEIFDKATEDFPNFGFYIDDQDGDVDDVELMEIDYDGNVEIISLEAEKAVVEMPATLTFNANISYKIPDTGMWDDENGVLRFQETAHKTVSDTARRSIAVEITFDGLEATFFHIRRVWFEGRKDIAVRADRSSRYWRYK